MCPPINDYQCTSCTAILVDKYTRNLENLELQCPICDSFDFVKVMVAPHFRTIGPDFDTRGSQ